MYFTKMIPSYPKDIHHFTSNKWSSTKELVFASLMAVLAAILQAAGGLLPGVGFLISPLTTAPILLGMVISFRSGILTYVLTICLLLIIEPSELFVFPFTTGILGLGLGWTFRILNRRLEILIINSFVLFIGICIPLYGLGFPVFGPISSSVDMATLIIIFTFSLLYSLLWLELGLYLLRKIKIILLPSK